jgi:hypothetical protein
MLHYMTTFVEVQSLNAKNEGLKSRAENKLFRVAFVVTSPHTHTHARAHTHTHTHKSDHVSAKVILQIQSQILLSTFV